jgi:hypothetical protein
VASSFVYPSSGGVTSVISMISPPVTVSVQINDLSYGTCGTINLFTVDTVAVDGRVYFPLNSGNSLTVIKAVYRVEPASPYCPVSFDRTGGVVVTAYVGRGVNIAVLNSGTIIANVQVGRAQSAERRRRMRMLMNAHTQGGNCASFTDCVSCTQTANCGWVAGSGCTAGTVDGSITGNAPASGGRWAWLSYQCNCRGSQLLTSSTGSITSNRHAPDSQPNVERRGTECDRWRRMPPPARA